MPIDRSQISVLMAHANGLTESSQFLTPLRGPNGGQCIIGQDNICASKRLSVSQSVRSSILVTVDMCVASSRHRKTSAMQKKVSRSDVLLLFTNRE